MLAHRCDQSILDNVAVASIDWRKSLETLGSCLLYQTVTKLEGAVAHSPKVSVCIPAYNHEKFIGPCLKSMLDQTMPDFEVLIADDCSSDDTVAAAQPYFDQRFRLFRHEKNGGVSKATNTCIDHARGEYICIVGSDDIFEPQKLQQQISYLNREPRVGLVFSVVTTIDEHGSPSKGWASDQEISEINKAQEGWLAEFFLGKNRLFAPSVMMRKQVVDRVGKFDERLLQTQDLDYWIRASMTFALHVLSEPLVRYRVHSNQANLSSNTPEKKARIFWELSKVMQRYRAIDDPGFLGRIFPDAKQYLSMPVSPLAALAIVAVNRDEEFTRNFGLDLLFELLDDPQKSKELTAAGYGHARLFQFATTAAVFPSFNKWDAEQAANWRNAYDNIHQEHLSLKAAYQEANVARDWWKDKFEKLSSVSDGAAERTLSSKIKRMLLRR